MGGMETDEVIWHPRGAPVSARFDDPYFSLEDGLAEARHVFLGGNDLPARFREGFCIAELGFGTGLNALAALAAWRAAGIDGVLRFTSFEAYPIGAAEMARALDVWPEVSADARLLAKAWAAQERDISFKGMELRVITGDARQTVPAWDGAVDAWFLDGFSPARNPQMWGEDLMGAVYARTAEGGTAATYSAAGAVRGALTNAGFEVERRPGFGRKRHMSVARK